MPVPTVEDVDRIAGLSDPVLRNLQITQCYHELSAALAQRTGPQANWCTFATWASDQAGRTIRQEDLARILEGLFNTSPAPAQALEVARLSSDLGSSKGREEILQEIWGSLNLTKAIEHTGRAVAAGNQKVFAEIGREFSRFVGTCLADSSPEPAKMAAFCELLRPGLPPEGQGYLSQAFTHLYQAIFEADDKRRAELLLLSNIEIGYHEQTRLQPEIQEALDAPFLDETQYIQRLIGGLFPRTAVMILLSRWLLTRLIGRPPLLELALRALLASAQVVVRRGITEALMTLTFPGDLRLRLWSDLVGQYPPLLQLITLPDLAGLLGQVDPTPDSLLESGAIDWADLKDRLHYIVDLFRLFQENQLLFEPPFTPDQVVAIKEGRAPWEASA